MCYVLLVLLANKKPAKGLEGNFLYPRMKEETRHFPIMDAGFDCQCSGAFFEELDFLKNLADNAILTSGHHNNIIHHIIIVLLTNLLYANQILSNGNAQKEQ